MLMSIADLMTSFPNMTAVIDAVHDGCGCSDSSGDISDDCTTYCSGTEHIEFLK